MKINQTDIKQNKKSKAIKIVLIGCGIILGLLIIIIGGIIYYLYVNHKLPNQSYSWNDKTKIDLKLTEKPQKSISSTIGCFADEPGCNEDTFLLEKETDAKVIVYVDQEAFVAEFKKYIEESKHESAIKIKEIAVEKVKSIISTSSEIDLVGLDEYMTNFGYNNDGYLHSYVENTFNKMLDEGKVAIYDLKNEEFVTNYTYVDYGFICGPLCGQGATDYILPNGKVFKSDSWIS